MSGRERRDYRSLGEILSDARRERELTVQQVSEKTKIAPRLIVSFENDELENLSGPVYARGFLRSLCDLYDLDRAWMMGKLEAGLETADPAPAELIPPTPAPRIESAPTEEDAPAAEPATGPSEQTWKIEKVDNARVRRIRPRARRGIPRRSLAVLVLIALLVLLVLFGRSLFRGDSTASDLAGGTDPSDDGPAPVAEDVVDRDSRDAQEEETPRRPRNARRSSRKRARRRRVRTEPDRRARRESLVRRVRRRASRKWFPTGTRRATG